ncbi:TolC family protein [Marinicaulis aureus]|uniref:TolC family protein n=1 Tax=Hyphococcus aureus TaxID=2666033 RepID=A0ABW1KY31_9PROT
MCGSMAGKYRFLSVLCVFALAPVQGFADDAAGSVYDAFDGAAAVDLEAQAPGTVIAAIRDALRHNPQLRIAEARQDAAKSERFRALGGFLPDVEATASYTDDRWRSDGLEVVGMSEGTTLGVTAVQPLFQGLSAFNRFRAARARVSQSELALLSTMQQTALDAARAHAGVILARKIVDHRIENMGLVSQQLNISEKRTEAGAQSRTGVEQARMRLAQAQVDLGEARTRLAQQEAAFIRITGRMPAAEMTEDMSDLADVFSSLEDALAIAREGNPAIAAAESAAKAARHDKSAATGAIAPQLTLEGSYFKRYGEDPLIASQADEEYQLVARMRMPLFRQGNNIANVRSANATVAQQEAQTTATLLAVEEIVNRTWRQLEQAKARRVAAESGIEAARQSVRGLDMEYSAGQRSVIDVLDGQRDLVIAQINASQADYEVRVTQYELAAATGTIFDAFGETSGLN